LSFSLPQVPAAVWKVLAKTRKRHERLNKKFSKNAFLIVRDIVTKRLRAGVSIY